MNALYHWLGFAVFWLLVAYITQHWVRRLWNSDAFSPWRRRILNIRWWVQTYLLRKPIRTNERWPGIVFSWYQRPHKLDGWERGMIAYTIRYNRRVGFLPEDAG